ncbi:thioredoxin family protein [Serpentinicella sp. ANB-PHB4]|uniref:thioredoxin family protein n=1 Tax=Serpentinicella sp. ANB-PHB4 TaxID=3074076 RepID=UPI0028559BC1|nr:thioredoxin family protein [Serpentinicella sp. ANB-PHB4]MDR5659140.1 thioredoxin family protein [Serpentinicella sp. ANB-PHB4]
MNIKIYEHLCCRGSTLEYVLLRAMEELNIDINYELISDMQAILNQGIVSPPALVIDGKIYLSGRIPSVDQVKSALLTASENK